ncbi:MAG TPA: SLBB domain-containing protein [Vicinamibacteria bacterium]|nr:SLBB domain-containing protein [Vicinamibacteria bacterium]
MSPTGAVVLLLLAQAPAAALEAPMPYRVGPGDVLELVVEGRPDLSRLPTVQTTGSVWLPRAGEVEVRGLTTGEIAAKVAPLLAGDDLASPRVAVRVKEYQSQFVWVRGAVRQPGRKPLRSGTRLVDALLDAGGFQDGASGEVIVERSGGTFADGAPSARFRFTGASPTPEALQELSLPLHAGDVITATIQRWVTVSGAVRRPGRHEFDEAPTLSRAVQAAGGLLHNGSERVLVRRKGGEVEVDLGAVRDGRAEDLALSPGDQVVVRARRL